MGLLDLPGHPQDCENCDASGFIQLVDDEDNCPCVVNPDEMCEPCRKAQPDFDEGDSQ